jgi:hypothetical protein
MDHAAQQKKRKLIAIANDSIITRIDVRERKMAETQMLLLHQYILIEHQH